MKKIVLIVIVCVCAHMCVLNINYYKTIIARVWTSNAEINPTSNPEVLNYFEGRHEMMPMENLKPVQQQTTSWHHLFYFFFERFIHVSWSYLIPNSAFPIIIMLWNTSLWTCHGHYTCTHNSCVCLPKARTRYSALKIPA